MPASVNTPSTSTHNNRTLRARSNTVTRLRWSTDLPVERLRWNECVPPDIGPGHPSDKFFEPIGWNPITRALGGPHLRGHHRACPDVLRGNHAFTEARDGD